MLLLPFPLLDRNVFILFCNNKFGCRIGLVFLGRKKF